MWPREDADCTICRCEPWKHAVKRCPGRARKLHCPRGCRLFPGDSGGVLRRFLLLIVIGLLAAAFIYFRQPGNRRCPRCPALSEVKEKLGQVGDKLRETKTAGSVKTALELDRDLQPYSFDVDADQTGVGHAEGRSCPATTCAVAPARSRRRCPEVDARGQPGRREPVAAPAPGDRSHVGENFDDKALEAKVHLAFSLNKDLKGTDLSVSAFKRAVTLSGPGRRPRRQRSWRSRSRSGSRASRA